MNKFANSDILFSKIWPNLLIQISCFHKLTKLPFQLIKQTPIFASQINIFTCIWQWKSTFIWPEIPKWQRALVCDNSSSLDLESLDFPHRLYWQQHGTPHNRTNSTLQKVHSPQLGLRSLHVETHRSWPFLTTFLYVSQDIYKYITIYWHGI